MRTSFTYLASKLIGDVRERYGCKLVAAVALMTVVAMSEGLAMALLLPLLGVVGVTAPQEGGVLATMLATTLRVLGVNGSPYLITLAIFLTLVIQLIFFVGQSWWLSWLQRDYGAYWQRRVFDSLLYAEWGTTSKYKLGNLASLITHDTNRLSGAFFNLLQILAVSVTVLVYSVVAALISWQATSLVLLVAVILAFAVKRLGRMIYEVGMEIGPITARFSGLVVEYLGGIKLIKATATESYASTQVGAVIDELKVKHTLTRFLPPTLKAILEFGSIASLCIILVIGHEYLDIPTANMLVIFVLFVRLLPRFSALQQNIHLLGNYLPALRDIEVTINEVESKSERARHVYGQDGFEVDPNATLSVKVHNAGYGDLTILRNIDIQFPPKGLVGIVGESGAGKTTFVNCLLGLIKIADGTLSFGGKNIADTPINAWRRQIGFVPQETVLFNLSIRDNIAWGSPSATDEEIVAAAKKALAHEFILNQPNGYDTVLSDRGGGLSGGQSQRLGIARALVRKPKLLVLDEATSALDSISEVAVLDTIESLRQDICVVMIAHRLSTLRAADALIVMENGSVAEVGTWTDLIGNKGAFHRLVAAQQLTPEENE